jgi:ribosomal protein L24
MFSCSNLGSLKDDKDLAKSDLEHYVIEFGDNLLHDESIIDFLHTANSSIDNTTSKSEIDSIVETLKRELQVIIEELQKNKNEVKEDDKQDSIKYELGLVLSNMGKASNQTYLIDSTDKFNDIDAFTYEKISDEILKYNDEYFLDNMIIICLFNTNYISEIDSIDVRRENDEVLITLEYLPINAMAVTGYCLMILEINEILKLTTVNVDASISKIWK